MFWHKQVVSVLGPNQGARTVPALGSDQLFQNLTSRFSAPGPNKHPTDPQTRQGMPEEHVVHQLVLSYWLNTAAADAFSGPSLQLFLRTN
jgi:hypothetical protein